MLWQKFKQSSTSCKKSQLGRVTLFLFLMRTMQIIVNKYLAFAQPTSDIEDLIDNNNNKRCQ